MKNFRERNRKNVTEFDQIIEDESKLINQCRSNKGIDKKIADTGAIGLALSGGGIRSASICLGALQSLHDDEILKNIDYISTVSGGGYIGASMVHLMNNPDESGLNKQKESKFWFPFEHKTGEAENKSSKHIRENVSYLLSGKPVDFIAAPMNFVSGLALNTLIFLPYLLIISTFIAVFLGGMTNHYMRKGFGPEVELDAPMFFLSRYLLIVLIIIFVADGAITRVRLFDKISHLLKNVMNIAVYVFLFFCLIEFIPLILFNIRSFVAAYLDTQSTGIREQSEAVLSTTNIVIYGIFTLAVLLMVSGVFYFYSKKKKFLRPFPLLLLGSLGPIVLISLILLFTHWIVSWGYSPDVIKSTARFLVSSDSEIIGVLLSFIKQINQYFSYLPFLTAENINEIKAKSVYSLPNPSLGVILLYWIIAIFLLLTTISFDVNRTSLHTFYKNKLESCFLYGYIKANGKYQLSPDTNKDLTSIAPTHAPYLLINTTMNIGTREKGNKVSNIKPFIISPLFCGSEGAYCQTGEFSDRDADFNLGTAIAVSGAAASPLMGRYTKPYMLMLLTLLNVRLGYWAPNPLRLNVQKLPYPSPKYFLSEMFGKINEQSAYVNLSDGGHYDNLGIIELLRRKCKLIIAVDAENDLNDVFTGFSNVIQLAKVELGIGIEIDTSLIRNDSDAKSTKHHAVGKISYGAEEHGTLLYLKSSITGDENDYIKFYKAKNPSFPHENTADQFFSDSQFEAYRALGYHLAQNLEVDIGQEQYNETLI